MYSVDPAIPNPIHQLHLLTKVHSTTLLQVCDAKHPSSTPGRPLRSKPSQVQSDLHELLQAGEIDVVDALLRRGADVLLDVCSVHKRQVYLLSHIRGG